MKTRERLRLRCVVWSQLAMLMIYVNEYDAKKCDHAGMVAGRLIRYARTVEPGNRGDAWLIDDSIADLRTEFLQLPYQVQGGIVATMHQGIIRTVEASKEDAELFVSVLDEEVKSLVKQIGHAVDVDKN